MTSFAEAKSSAIGLLDFLEHCDEKYQEGLKRTKVSGELTREAAEQPSWLARYDQLRIELKALKSIHETKLRRKKGELWRHYLEHYNRQLATKDIEQYILSDKRYQEIETVVSEIEVHYDKMSSLVESLRVKGWSITNTVKLRTQGLEDALV